MKFFLWSLVLFAGFAADAGAFRINLVDDVSKVKPRDLTVPLPFPQGLLHSPRIVGGWEAEPNSIPYQVALLLFVGDIIYFCGGSLISANWVLTAAHCVENTDEIMVIAGAHRPLQAEPTQQIRTATRHVIHSNWNPNALLNDIALVYVAQSFVLDGKVLPVGLPTRSQVGLTFVGNSTRLSGWGMESNNQETISEVLREIVVDVVANLICNIFFLGGINPSHICTSGDGSVGPCFGDSGNPLVLNGTNTIVGVLSFIVEFSCQAGWPAGYTRVTSFLNWISENSGIAIED